MKNRRTDPLSLIPGKAIEIRGNAVITRFDDGKVFMRDKSHFKIVCERFCFETQERVVREKTTSEDNTQQRLKTIYSIGGEPIRIREMQRWTGSIVMKQKINRQSQTVVIVLVMAIGQNRFM